MYDYDIGRMYLYDSQVGYESSGKRRKYRAFNVHLKPTMLSPEQ